MSSSMGRAKAMKKSPGFVVRPFFAVIETVSPQAEFPVQPRHIHSIFQKLQILVIE